MRVCPHYEDDEAYLDRSKCHVLGSSLVRGAHKLDGFRLPERISFGTGHVIQEEVAEKKKTQKKPDEAKLQIFR